jgi:hypothetical protein
MTKDFSIQMSPGGARLLTLLVYPALASGYLASAAWPALEGPAFGLVGLLKIGGLCGALVLFLSAFGQKSQQPDARLDERERDERNRAYVATHRIMLGLLFGFLIYGVLADLLGLWLPTGEGARDLLSAFAIGSMALPGAILAWRDRAVPDEG